MNEDLPGVADADRSQESNRPGRVAVVLTALDVEIAAVLRRLPDATSQRRVGGTHYEIGVFQGKHVDWTVATAVIGEGNLGAAVEATAAIRDIRPDLIMFVGVAGGLKADVPHGSVVVATKVYSYHGGKAESEFLSRPLAISTDHALEQTARAVQRTAWMADPRPLVTLKPIAAGEQVLASRESAQFRLLRERYNDAVAIDMESAGMYVAAERADQLPAIAIRGISDMLDDKGAAADVSWQPVAADNAAAFAFAVLRAVRPEDLVSRGASAEAHPARIQSLTSIPPTAAAALSNAIACGTAHAADLLVELTGSKDPNATADRLVATSSVLDGAKDAVLWVAVGEFAVAHRNHLAGAIAFRNAAEIDKRGAGRWHARAALALASAGSGSDAEDQLRRAKESGQDTILIDVIEAAIAEDPRRILDTSRGHRLEDPLIDVLVVQALAATGAIDDAIDLGRRSIAETSTHPNTGSLALLIAQFLVVRDQSANASSLNPRDLYDALNLALLVRDSRRVWGGPSSQAAYIAASAAIRAGEPATALRFAAPAPVGEATEAESADPELVEIAARASIALGRFDEARLLAEKLTSEVQRVLISVDCDLAQGIADEKTRLRLREVLPKTEPGDRFLAYMQLVELGEASFPDIESLGDPEAIEVVLSQADLKSGRTNEAIRRLRKLVTPRGQAFLVEAYLHADRISDAVETLRESANRFGQPRFFLRAAMLLGKLGRFGEAIEEATRVLAVAPPQSALARDARALLIEASSRIRDWTAVAQHASAAIADGFEEPDFRWALLWAHFSRRDLVRARQIYQALPIRPRDDDDAILVTQLLRTSPGSQEVVQQILDLAEQHRGSERVSAAAFMAVIEVSRDLDLPPELRERQQRLSQAFFETWPASQILYRIDASDIQNVVDHLRETLKPSSRLVEETAQKVQLGLLPYGLLAAVVGRSVAEALVKNAAGCIPSGEPDGSIAAAEDVISAAALDGRVVADASAFLGALRTGLEPSVLTSGFSAVFAATATVDDAFVAADALRLKSTSNMGWNAREDRAQLIEVTADVAEAWAEESERLLSLIKSASLREPKGDRHPKFALEATLAPIRLAKELGVPLWSDERAMRAFARSDGVPAFATFSLLRALVGSGALTEDAQTAAILQMLRNGIVDFEIEPAVVLELAASEGWNGQRAGIFLSRSTSWTDPATALDLYGKGLRETVVREPSLMAQWSFAASVGAARRSSSPCTMPPVVLLSGFSAIELQPEHLPNLLAGVRAAASLLQCADPLPAAATLLAASLRKSFGESIAATAFTRLIADLNPEDRATAFGRFMQS